MNENEFVGVEGRHLVWFCDSHLNRVFELNSVAKTPSKLRRSSVIIFFQVDDSCPACFAPSQVNLETLPPLPPPHSICFYSLFFLNQSSNSRSIRNPEHFKVFPFMSFFENFVLVVG